MARFTLMRNEEMKLKVQPHPLSFLHLYFVFLLLLVWGFVIHRFFSQDWFSQVPFYSFLIGISVINEVVAASIIWSLALLAIGFAARYLFLDNGGRDIFRLYGGLALFGIGVMVLHFWKIGEAEGDTQLDVLYRHCVRSEFLYSHRWSKDYMLIWDNRLCLH